jgi:HTH-type transcriptional regulator/antitoxin HigA
MDWKVLKSEEDYNNASIRMMEIFHAEPNTPENDELDLLIVLIKDYDEKHYQLPELDALEVIKYKMQEMGLKAKDLEPIIGSKGHVSAILSGKREITLKMAQKLKNYFSIPADVFLHSA